jgi:D-alanyl-D-alanine carboxypeptidase/D-alanyl-D-alanine endopeptidase (penicillin-binding protein 7)
MRWTVMLAASLMLACSTGRAEVRFGSAHAIVVDEASGEVLLQKDVLTAAPMASLTKLMTAMVVLDAGQNPDEGLRIDAVDQDRRSHGGVPVGAVVSRHTLLELSLIASDNHAAAALARHYPGGIDAFQTSMRRKIQALGLTSTLIEEPTGLSPNNLSSAQDMVKVLRASAAYPAITQITSQRSHVVQVNGRRWAVHNTNRFVGAPGWNILLSKTGFTNEAGRCLSMRLQAAGRTVMVVLMGAGGAAARTHDALNIRRWLGADPGLAAAPVHRTPLRFAADRRHDGALEPRPGFFPRGTEAPAVAPVEAGVGEAAQHDVDDSAAPRAVDDEAAAPLDAPAQTAPAPTAPAPGLAGA